MSEDRNLTDADAQKVAEELKKLLVQDFYQEVGKGVWGWVKKVAVLILLLAAAYGIINDGRMFSVPPGAIR